MPLDRAHVTVASRVMLPAYVLFFGVIGMNYLASPQHRLIASPALAYADKIMPLSAWGGVFLVAAALMLSALALHLRLLYRYALLVCAVSMAVWTGVTILAAFHGETTFGAWAYPFLVVCACVASDRSLNVQEV